MTEPSRDPSTDDTTVEIPIVRKTDQSCQMEHLQGVVPNGNLMNSLPVSRTISPRNPGTGRSRRPSNVSAAPSPIRSTARLTRGIHYINQYINNIIFNIKLFLLSKHYFRELDRFIQN